MSYAGDITLGDTIDLKFTSRRFSTGAPHTLSSGAVAAYVGNGTTEITAGITLTADFDSRTGLNNVRVVATSGNGFASGTDVTLVLTAGSVDSVSVAGEVVGSFSIENRHGSAPTAAAVADAVWDEARAGHVTAGTFGEGMSVVAFDAAALQQFYDDDVNAAGGDIITGSLMAGLLEGMFLHNTGQTYATAVAGSVVKEIVDNTPGGTGATTGQIADAVWDEARSGHVAAGSFGEYVNATPVAGSITASVIAAGAIDADALATDAAQEIADVTLRRQMANVEGSSHGDTLSLSSLYGLVQQAQESSVSGTTLTVKKTDGSTTLGTKTLATDDGADPVTGIS